MSETTYFADNYDQIAELRRRIKLLDRRIEKLEAKIELAIQSLEVDK